MRGWEALAALLEKLRCCRPRPLLLPCLEMPGSGPKQSSDLLRAGACSEQSIGQQLDGRKAKGKV